MVKRNFIGDNVRRLRKERNFTQEELAAKLQIEGLNIDRPMITKIELQQREVYDYEAFYISKVLKVSIEELFKINNL